MSNPINFKKQGRRAPSGPVSNYRHPTPMTTSRTRGHGDYGSLSHDSSNEHDDHVEYENAAEPPPERPASGPTNVFFSRVKSDPQMGRTFALLNSGKFAMDLAGLTREIYHLQFNRNLRRPNIARDMLQESQKTIIEADMQHAAYRSRATEIRMQCYEVSDLLDQLIKDSREYLLSKYPNELKNSGYTTRDARQNAVDHVLTVFRNRKRELDRVIELSRLVIEDIDKTSYNVSHTIDVLTLSVSRGRGL